jgi:UDP-glucuronate decarboxylase
LQINIGSSHEFTILEFAEAVRDIVEKVQKEEGTFKRRVEIIHKDLPGDDPKQRRADTARAEKVLGWKSRWGVQEGVEEMVSHTFKLGLLFAGDANLLRC